MRLQHWKLIPYLPNQQLLGQWRECCAIRKAMWENETPNHLLVNPVCEYPMTEYNGYWKAVQNEMEKRGLRFGPLSGFRLRMPIQTAHSLNFGTTTDI